MRLLKAMQEAERFSSTEQSVIDYMLKNPTEIASLSIRELAAPAGERHSRGVSHDHHVVTW